MKTERFSDSPEDLIKAAALLRAGKLVAMPTETVYGLAADARNPQAVTSIFEAKGRPQDNPLIVHIADIRALDSLTIDRPPVAHKLAKAFWPGPLTMIFRRAASVPAQVSAGLDTVAVRMPAHPVAQRLIALSGCPLAAPSANRSGRPSPTTAAHVLSDLDGRIAAVVDGGPSNVGLESTVVDVTTDPVTVYRPGAVTVEMLREVVGEVAVSEAILKPLGAGDRAASPGMKYKHYAPRAQVTLVRGTKEAFNALVELKAARFSRGEVMAACFDKEEDGLSVPFFTYGRRDDPAAQAAQIFDVLRRFDETSTKQVYVSCPTQWGLGLAVYNRLLRAAAFRVIDLGQRPFCIGLTGPTGAGKGEVARVWEKAGSLIIDTDRLAREVVRPGTACLSQLVQAFSPAILNADGTLCRAELARRAFASPEKTALLNRIVHPAVIALCEDILQKTDRRVAVIDAPLLFESGADRLCGVTVGVLAGEEHRFPRIVARDGLDEAAARRRMNAQPNAAFYEERCDAMLSNDGPLTRLQQEAAALWKRIERCLDG